jgi:PhnB protein
MKAYKPPAYNSVSPYLASTDAKATLEFLKQAFGGQELRRHDRPDGTIGHAEIKVDDTVIMLSDATDQWPAVAAHVHLYVQDVDASYAAALRFGATSVQAPVCHDDEDKRGGVKDPGGTTWWIATSTSHEN